MNAFAAQPLGPTEVAVKNRMEEVALSDKGTDKKVKIFINDHKYEAPKPVMTGAELKILAGIASDNQLFLDAPGNHDDPQILDQEQAHLKSGMKFYDVPVGNLGAR